MTRLVVYLDDNSRVLWVASKRSRKAEKLARLVAAAAMAALLAGCAGRSPPPPPPPPPPQAEFCQLVPPHEFSKETSEFFSLMAWANPGVKADLDYLADLTKTRRCLCGGAQDGCPK